MDLEKEEYRKTEGEKKYLSVSTTEACRSGSNHSFAPRNGKRYRSGQDEVLSSSKGPDKDDSEENSGASGDEDEHPASASVISHHP